MPPSAVPGQLHPAEKALADTKEQIKALRRQARHEIFKVEDEIMDKRDLLIDQLEQRLAQRTTTETLFMIRWAVV